MSGEWVPISMFLSVALIAVVFLVLRFRGKRELQKTVRLALEKNHELSPALLASLDERKRSPQADFRRGLIGVAIGASFALFALILGEQDAIRPMLGISAFPFLVGAAYLGLSKYGGRSDREQPETLHGGVGQ